MKTYYFSGIDRAKFVEILAREGGAGMVNYEVAHQPAMVAACERFPEVPLVLDSNIFRKGDDIHGYIDCCHRFGGRFRWLANFDVLGNQRASDDNWRRMKDAGLSPLWVYQTRGGSSLDDMQRWASELGFIGVGGLVPIVKTDVSRALVIIREVGHRLSEVGARCHLFGINSPLIIREIVGENWFESADSQAWLCGFKAQDLIAADGRRVSATEAGFHFSREECAAQNIRSVHSWFTSNRLQLSFGLE